MDINIDAVFILMGIVLFLYIVLSFIRIEGKDDK